VLPLSQVTTPSLPPQNPAAGAAQAARPDADPAMWVVKDADTTIYLFGTFHMLDGKRDWLNDEVTAAFDKSSELGAGGRHSGRPRPAAGRRHADRHALCR
jgi:uncharacterized protein YbaP (TraB family)